MGSTPTIAYLVHDTNDPAVARRVAMFRAGGGEVRLAGFRRREALASVAGVAPNDLGRTADARLTQRAGSVLGHVARPGRVRRTTKGADIIVARNLESLALAVRAATRGQRIVFECLDIHRMMLGEGRVGAAMRAIERRLLARTALLVTSSPAFVRQYFLNRQGYTGPVHVEENRLLVLNRDRPAPVARTADGVVRIGWFGMLRCHRSLAILRDLVAGSKGRVEVLMAGVPSYTEFDDFDAQVTGLPGLRFIGRYAAQDLPALYGEVDLAWGIDYFEAGQNSAWLLPNRLYESLAFGVVPIALRGVETARWLEAHGVGLILDDPARDAARVIPALGAAELAGLRARAANVPQAAVIATADDCRRLVDVVAGNGAAQA